METIIHTGGSANSLGYIIKDVRQKARKNPIMASAVRKLANSPDEVLYNFLGIAGSMAMIHEDYKPIRTHLVINGRKRDRRQTIEKLPVECNHDFMLEIVDNCSNKETEEEVLREDETLCMKSVKEFYQELNVLNEPPDIIVERVIQTIPFISKCTIFGFCRGYVVYGFRQKSKGKEIVHINALKCKGWGFGVRIFSKNID